MLLFIWQVSNPVKALHAPALSPLLPQSVSRPGEVAFPVRQDSPWARHVGRVRNVGDNEIPNIGLAVAMKAPIALSAVARD